MKPALLITLDYPPRVGGVATYLSRLVDDFPIGGIRVLAQREGDTHAIDVVSPAPLYRRRLVTGWLRPRWLPAAYWTDRFCRDEPPSVILTSHILPLGRVARMIGRRRKIPYVIICHGMDVALALKSGRKRRLAKPIMADAALVVANSQFTAGLAEALGAAKEKIRVIPPSPSFPAYQTVPDERVAEIRSRFSLDGWFTVLSAGRLVARKGFDTVIESVAGLKRLNRAVKCVIVGDGPERDRLEKLAARLEVSDRVVFAGYLNGQELAAAYTASDAFIMVPRAEGPDIEGYGIVYIDAGVFGKPCIGSRSGGVPEAVIDGRTGILVNPSDVSGLAGAVTRLMDDLPLRERLGREARERVLGEFGSDRLARQFMAALDEAVGFRL
jgi:phosphatidylinositol alpha-1,6-mannosyltransferase